MRRRRSAHHLTGTGGNPIKSDLDWIAYIDDCGRRSPEQTNGYRPAAVVTNDGSAWSHRLAVALAVKALVLNKVVKAFAVGCHEQRFNRRTLGNNYFVGLKFNVEVLDLLHTIGHCLGDRDTVDQMRYRNKNPVDIQTMIGRQIQIRVRCPTIERMARNANGHEVLRPV